MSLETRSSSALFKRAEQLKRWEESETNRELTVPNNRTRKIQFSAGCVFLAACAAGDKDEVLRLLQKGADIDTANVDGLTALHQACIDDDLDMVEFLVGRGSDVNRGDNEGWTPLHATASCGFTSIARYLVEHGADVAAVNNDAELPLDIADSDEMEEMLQNVITAKGIDADEARNEEERLMLADAREWLNGGDAEDLPHPKTGATALHVAAAKGYIKVMNVLLQGKEDVNMQDFDGWTPLHAAAHWGQREACELLVENFCDMDVKNYVGQTSFDVADPEMVRSLEELKKKQATLERDRGDTNSIVHKTGTNTQKRRSSITRMSVADKSNLINKDASAERQLRDRTISEESSNKVKKIELEISSAAGAEKEDPSKGGEDSEVEKKNRVNRDEPSRIAAPPIEAPPTTVPTPAAPTSPPRAAPTETDDTAALPSWRRPGSVRLRGADEPPNKLRIGEAASPAAAQPPPPKVNSVDTAEVQLRRTHSFESDEKFYQRYKELQARIKAGSCPALHSYPSSALPTRSVSMREKHLSRRGIREEPKQEAVTTPTATPAATPTTPVLVSTASTTVPTAKVTPSSPTATSPLPTSQVRRSFVPPVRDEESETQRKAHAKRVRETRRSTQGVTLEEIKSAEEMVKKKNNQLAGQPAAPQTANNAEQPASTSNTTSITATITTAAPTVPAAAAAAAVTSPASGKDDQVPSLQERRPSWRLRVDNGDKSKFLLEDARNRNVSADPATAYVRRTPAVSATRPASAPAEATPADASVTIALRRNSKPPDDDKEQDKENDSRTAQATQAVIQRRRRPKRRSTGVVHVDMDEIDPDRQDSGGRGEEDSTKANKEESGGDYSGRSSRHNSVSSTGGGGDAAAARSAKGAAAAASENGELDYKKLYEEASADNDRLRETLKKTDKELADTKSHLIKASAEPSKSSLSEIEKRERRAMERKLSEMEEELKLLDQIRSENQRLKDENGALIRVISKLSK